MTADEFLRRSASTMESLLGDMKQSGERTFKAAEEMRRAAAADALRKGTDSLQTYTPQPSRPPSPRTRAANPSPLLFPDPFLPLPLLL